jgi:hypothetical protein
MLNNRIDLGLPMNMSDQLALTQIVKIITDLLSRAERQQFQGQHLVVQELNRPLVLPEQILHQVHLPDPQLVGVVIEAAQVDPLHLIQAAAIVEVDLGRPAAVAVEEIAAVDLEAAAEDVE